MSRKNYNWQPKDTSCKLCDKPGVGPILNFPMLGVKEYACDTCWDAAKLIAKRNEQEWMETTPKAVITGMRAPTRGESISMNTRR